MKEEWKTLEEFPNYKISNYGNIISLNYNKTKTVKYLKLFKSKKTYVQVTLFNKQKKETSRLVHRLVLEAFVGPRPPKHQAAHFDGNRHNNFIGNLRWATVKENYKDKARQGNPQIGETAPHVKLSKQEVLFIRNNYKRSSYRVSNARDLAEKFGVDRIHIIRLVKKTSWKHV